MASIFNSPDGSACGSGASCTATATESAEARIGMISEADCARGGRGSPIAGAEDISSRDLRLRSASNGDGREVRGSECEAAGEADRDAAGSGRAGAGRPDETPGAFAALLKSSSSGSRR